MFGNKYAGVDIAAEMYNLLNKSESDSKVKIASEEATPSLEAKAEATPESFLVSPVSDSEDVGAQLDSKIDEMASYAGDKCEVHNEALDSCDCGSAVDDAYSPGDMMAESLVDDASMAEDMSYLVDARAKVGIEQSLITIR